MSYYLIIRGPLGCGKSTISRALAKKLNAKHFAVDEILDKFKLANSKEEGYISQKSFFKVNEIVAKEAKKLLERDKPVIFDGNFYWKSVIRDLETKLKYKHLIFTLKASLETCVFRDRNRGRSCGVDATRAVYKKSTSFKCGELIDTDDESSHKTLMKIMEILKIKFRKA